MADATLSEALTLFSKVNTKMLDRLIKLEKASDPGTSKKEPEQVVQKAAPVQVESFGKKAIDELKKIIGTVQTPKKDEIQKGKKGGMLDWLLGALGALGAGLAGMYDTIKKWLKDKLLGGLSKVKDLLVSGMKKLLGGVKGLWSGVKNAFTKITKTFTSGAKWIGNKIKSAFTKLKESNFGKGINTFFRKIGASIGSFSDKIINGAKSLGEKLAEKFAVVKNAMKSLTAKASEAILGKEGSKTLVGKAVDVTKSAAKAVGGAVTKGVSAVGGAVSKTYSTVTGAVKAGGEAVMSRGKVIADITKKIGGFKFTAGIFSNLLKRVPIIGSLIETFLTKSDISEMVERHTKDPSKYTEEMLYNDIGKRLSEGIGGVLGAAGGASLGGIVGSVLPVAGTTIGAIGGGVAGDWVGRKVFGAIARSIGGDTTKEIGKFIYDRFYKDSKTDKVSPKQTNITEEKVDDAAIYPGGNRIVKPHPDDSIYAMKEGGPMDKFFTKNLKVTKEGNDILKQYAENTNDIMLKQLKLLTENNKLLNALAEKLNTPANIISKPTVIANNFSNGNTLRSLQGVLA